MKRKIFIISIALFAILSINGCIKESKFEKVEIKIENKRGIVFNSENRPKREHVLSIPLKKSPYPYYITLSHQKGSIGFWVKLTDNKESVFTNSYGWHSQNNLRYYNTEPRHVLTIKTDGDSNFAHDWVILKKNKWTMSYYPDVNGDEQIIYVRLEKSVSSLSITNKPNDDYFRLKLFRQEE